MNENCCECEEATMCVETLRKKLDRIANLLVNAGAIAGAIESKAFIPRPCEPHGTEPTLRGEASAEEFVDLIGYRIGILTNTLRNVNDLL
jgi:hypothetical protein